MMGRRLQSIEKSPLWPIPAIADFCRNVEKNKQSETESGYLPRPSYRIESGAGEKERFRAFDFGGIPEAVSLRSG